MQGIESGATRTTGGSVHPAVLLALAIGIAIGACLSGPPARSAEAAPVAAVHDDCDAEDNGRRASAARSSSSATSRLAAQNFRSVRQGLTAG